MCLFQTNLNRKKYSSNSDIYRLEISLDRETSLDIENSLDIEKMRAYKKIKIVMGLSLHHFLLMEL